MNYNYTACCWFPTTRNILYFHHSSDKSGLKVTECTVQSAEYWCSYGTFYKFTVQHEWFWIKCIWGNRWDLFLTPIFTFLFTVSHYSLFYQFKLRCLPMMPLKLTAPIITSNDPMTLSHDQGRSLDLIYSPWQLREPFLLWVVETDAATNQFDLLCLRACIWLQCLLMLRSNVQLHTVKGTEFMKLFLLIWLVPLYCKWFIRIVWKHKMESSIQVPIWWNYSIIV